MNLNYVYIYTNGVFPIYIGKTNNVFRRNLEHKRDDEWHKHCKELYFARVDEDMVDLYEGYLINKYSGLNIKNKVHPNEWRKYGSRYIEEKMRYLKWECINLSEINNMKNEDGLGKYLISCYDRNYSNSYIKEVHDMYYSFTFYPFV